MKVKTILLLLLVLLLGHAKAQTYAASNFTLLSLIDPETTANSNGEKYSGCWGWYQADKNREYAIACSQSGTYWIDVTNPSTPTVAAYKAGRLSGCTWRETKSYGHYLYVISDDYGNNSFQIFDMRYLPDSVHKVYDGQDFFVRAHTLWVNQDKLYIASATRGQLYSSMQVYSLANPESPVLIRSLDQDYPTISYVHDMYARNDTIFASCGYQGLYVYKLTASNTFTLLGSLVSYPYSGYNHSSALTPNGQTLVFTDEIPTSMPIKIANVSNLNNIQMQATVNQYPNTTPHNPFMANNQYCFVSSYQDGLQLFDISTPSVPVLAGYFDTHPQSGGNNNTWPSNSAYDGQWGSYPYLPSGKIFALDEQNGAFMLGTSLYQAPLVSAGFNMPAVVCLGNPVNVMNTSTGANTFTWSFPAGVTSTATPGEAILSFSATGTYTVALTAANPASNSASVIHTITVINNPITTAITSTNTSCNTCSTGIVLVTPSGGTAPYSYTWAPRGGHNNYAMNLPAGCYTVNLTDAFGCAASTSTCIAFDVEAGLPGVAGAESLRIYPNPAGSEVCIRSDLSQSIHLQIRDLAGRLIFEKKMNGPANTSIDLRSFANGTYFISLKGSNFSTTKKLIVQH